MTAKEAVIANNVKTNTFKCRKKVNNIPMKKIKVNKN